MYQSNHSIIVLSKTQKIILVLLIVLFSLALKLKDYQVFIDPDAFLVTADSFRYARHAIELQNGNYGKIDYLANVPDFGINQYPPPLLSMLAVWISKIFGIDIRYLFLIMPPVLGVLFVLPLYFWLKPLNNDYVTFGGITMGLFSFHYHVRTRGGYFDTDCLMLFFVFTIVLFITRAVAEKDNQMGSYSYILLAGLSMTVFRWWYDHLFFVFIFLCSLILGLIVWRHGLKDIFLKSSFFVAISSPVELFYYIFANPFITEYLAGNILRIESFKVPINAFASVGELLPVNLSQVILFTTDNKLSFALAVIFGAVLLLKNIKLLSTSLPILFIALLAFYHGNRYLIYIGPFIGMGFGYGMYIMISYITNRLPIYQKAFYIAGLLLLISLLVPPQIVQFKTKPLFIDKTMSSLIEINRLTERNVYIWTWWGLGNQIQYYSKRALYVDNTHFDPLKLYIIIQSLTAQNEELTYKSIAFLTNNRRSEYEGLTKSLPQLINRIDDYNTPPSKPVYVLLNNGMLERFVLKDNALPKDEADYLSKRLPIANSICPAKEGIIMNCDGFVFDQKTIDVKISDKKIESEYKKIVYYSKQDFIERDFPLNSNAENIMYLILSKDGNLHKITAHEDFEQTMLFRMLIVSENNFQHFELVYDDFPYAVLYRVKRDNNPLTPFSKGE